MKKHMVITIVGRDRRGLVEEVTEVLLAHGANIEESRMARLGGEFAGMMLIYLPSNRIEPLTQALAQHQPDQLSIFTRLTDLSRVKKFEGFVPYEIAVYGADHEGIVHSIAQLLAEDGVNIETMDTHVGKAPTTGTPIFSMNATVQVPPEITPHQFREQLDDLGDNLGVDIEVQLLGG